MQFDPEWCADTLKIEGNNTILKKQSKIYFILIKALSMVLCFVKIIWI